MFMFLFIFITYFFFFFLFFFNDPATTEIYTLSLHDALPLRQSVDGHDGLPSLAIDPTLGARTERLDRKSTRLNSSHITNSDAVSCLKKKNIPEHGQGRIPHRDDLCRAPSRLGLVLGGRRRSRWRRRPRRDPQPFFFFRILRPPRFTLFPYTTLFR